MIKPKRDSNGLITGALVVDDNTNQCVALVLGMSQGELKEDPLLGAGLTKFIRGKQSKSQIEQVMRQHLTRAGINYNEYKEQITTIIKTKES
ncbi:hypothetical protein [Labilibaculum sp.]|uniref:hypothetical protein n=1 Tax=Labilibaculum sp. TaxID=2060723 RepID=UPI002AA66A76|nr:hypothetical protein [Labilibaculum sp.]